MVSDGASHATDPRKYVQLASLLRGQILDGTLRPGDCAPSITTLAAEHGGWARQTCAKALRMLEAEGLLLRVHGLGYFINDPTATQSSSAQQPPILRVAELLHSRHDESVQARAFDLLGSSVPVRLT
jgi:DNA-binding GntR family transcriptional regulator